MKSGHYKKVEEFMRLAKQGTPSEPTMPDEETRLLRAKLIFEEALETIEGLGFNVCLDRLDLRCGDIEFEANNKEDLVEIIDGCCDIKVVTTGTLVACGVPDKLFQEEVDQNNLDKFGPGHSFREDGKLIKPPDHKPPKIKELLKCIQENTFLLTVCKSLFPEYIND